MSQQSTEFQSGTRSSRTRLLVLVAIIVACVGVGLGFVTHSEGTMGQGGVECGSVWFVSAYHSGCDEWLDDMSRVVFGAIGLSVSLLLVGLVRWRGWRGLVWVLPAAGGLMIAAPGPRLWREGMSAKTSDTDWVRFTHGLGLMSRLAASTASMESWALRSAVDLAFRR